MDAAGRAIPIPATVARVFPAGPPAAILTYTLAPDILIGWPRANRPEECEFMLPDVCARPEVGPRVDQAREHGVRFAEELARLRIGQRSPFPRLGVDGHG